MTYKISKGRPKKISEKYYQEKEIQELREKYKGKRIPFFEAERVGTRNIFHVEKLVHTVGNSVYYKGQLAIVKKSTKQGIWIEKFKSDRSGIAYPSGKLTFVKQKDVIHQVYPAFYPQASAGVVSPYNMGTLTTIKD